MYTLNHAKAHPISPFSLFLPNMKVVFTQRLFLCICKLVFRLTHPLGDRLFKILFLGCLCKAQDQDGLLVHSFLKQICITHLDEP